MVMWHYNAWHFSSGSQCGVVLSFSSKKLMCKDWVYGPFDSLFSNN
jgi:hypothetical protein